MKTNPYRKRRWVIPALAAAAVPVTAAVLVFGAGPAGAAVNLNECPILALGYHGGCVNELQLELNMVDNSGLSVDGTYGPATRNAVIAYQKARGIRADGMVGPATKAALGRDLSVPTPRLQPAPAPNNNDESSDWCLASTAAICPPGGEAHDHPEVEPGQLRDGYELWRNGASNSGETFPMPGRLVPEEPFIP
jgi:peptidoglycan hydrolase-like protein with peptidoglycan-binding domain